MKHDRHKNDNRRPLANESIKGHVQGFFLPQYTFTDDFLVLRGIIQWNDFCEIHIV